MFRDGFAIEDIPYDVLKDTYRYWLDIRGRRRMPSRDDLNPADIVSLLPNISLVDVEHDSGRYKIRLVGTETVKVMGVDLTGRYLDELPNIERFLKDRYDWMVRERRPYLYSDKLEWADKNYYNFCSLGLPLSRDGEDVDILMYSTYYDIPAVQRSRLRDEAGPNIFFNNQ